MYSFFLLVALLPVLTLGDSSYTHFFVVNALIHSCVVLIYGLMKFKNLTDSLSEIVTQTKVLDKHLVDYEL